MKSVPGLSWGVENDFFTSPSILTYAWPGWPDWRDESHPKLRSPLCRLKHCSAKPSPPSRADHQPPPGSYPGRPNVPKHVTGTPTAPSSPFGVWGRHLSSLAPPPPWGAGQHTSGASAALPFTGKTLHHLLLKICISRPGVCVALTLPLWCHLALQGAPPKWWFVFQDSGPTSCPPPSRLPPPRPHTLMQLNQTLPFLPPCLSPSNGDKAHLSPGPRPPSPPHLGTRERLCPQGSRHLWPRRPRGEAAGVPAAAGRQPSALPFRLSLSLDTLHPQLSPGRSSAPHEPPRTTPGSRAAAWRGGPGRSFPQQGPGRHCWGGQGVGSAPPERRYLLHRPHVQLSLRTPPPESPTTSRLL